MKLNEYWSNLAGSRSSAIVTQKRLACLTTGSERAFRAASKDIGNCCRRDAAGKNKRRRVESGGRRERGLLLMTTIKINLRGRRLTRKLNSSLAIPPRARSDGGAPFVSDRTRSPD